MEIKRGMYFKGMINGKTIRIENASEQAVTFRDCDNQQIFTVGRKMFEHCYLEKI